jgi:flagellar protein FlbD
MILLTRMDRQLFFINPDHIVSIEETPDTVITLFNDHHFIVRDSAEVIINKIIAYKASILRRAGGNSNPKKYLAKSNRKSFRNSTLNSGIRPLVASSSKHRTPFHGLEL